MHAGTFKYKKITDIILKSFYEVYNELGDGFLESVYENALYIVLTGFKRFVYDNKRKNIGDNQRKSVAE
jgi:GxxExxY protein